MKDFIDDTLDSVNKESHKVFENMKKVLKGNSALKQSLEDLERKMGLLEFDIKEMEVKHWKEKGVF